MSVTSPAEADLTAPELTRRVHQATTETPMAFRKVEIRYTGSRVGGSKLLYAVDSSSNSRLLEKNTIVNVSDARFLFLTSN